MNSKRSSRRQFLQRAAAAGLAARAVGSASAQSRGVAAKPEAKPILAEASRFPVSGLEVSKRIDHITYYTPIQDWAGIITPAPLHFIRRTLLRFLISIRRNIASPSTAWWSGR